MKRLAAAASMLDAIETLPNPPKIEILPHPAKQVGPEFARRS
jgi:hypothetical protein